jgi:hypothetical protein
VKAKNGKSLSAQCAGAGAGAGAHVPTRVSERGEWVKRANRTGTKGGTQSERERASVQKEGARRRNKGRRERKPASFRPLTTEFEMRELFVARKLGLIERKCLLLQANKHNTSLSFRNTAYI